MVPFGAKGGASYIRQVHVDELYESRPPGKDANLSRPLGDLVLDSNPLPEPRYEPPLQIILGQFLSTTSKSAQSANIILDRVMTMTTTATHASYRAGGVTPDVPTSGPELVLDVFRNDANNVSAAQIARLEKARLEEANRLHELRLSEAAASLAEQITNTKTLSDERDSLLAAKIELETTVQQLQTQKSTLETKNKDILDEKASILTDKTKLETTVQQLQTQKSTLERDNKTLTESNSKLQTTGDERWKEARDWERVAKEKTTKLEEQSEELRIANAVLKLGPYRNDNGKITLNEQLNNAKVIIMNVASTLALDSARDGGTKAHGHTYSLDNPNQLHRLEYDTRGVWLIRRWPSQDRCLYFPRAGSYVDLGVTHRERWEPGFDELCWCIRPSTVYPGAWTFQNIHTGGYINLTDPGRNPGINIQSSSLLNESTMHWVIIVLARG